MKKGIIIILILFIIAVAIYFAFAKTPKEENQTPEISYETINMITALRLGVSEFDSIDPYITKNREVLYIDSLIFEPLLSITQDYKITNELAKEWSKVGPKSYVIKLKENVKWSDGAVLKAEDIKNSVETIQKNKESIYYENVKEIKNVEVVDNTTINIELTKEIPFFEYNLIFPIVKSIVSSPPIY